MEKMLKEQRLEPDETYTFLGHYKTSSNSSARLACVRARHRTQCGAIDSEHIRKYWCPVCKHAWTMKEVPVTIIA